MSKRTLALVLLVTGLVLAIVALAADPLGLGGYPGVGKRQTAGIVVGVGLAVVAAFGLRSPD